MARSRIHLLLIGLACVPFWGTAEVQSVGGFVGGSVSASVGPVQAQATLVGGLGSSLVSSFDEAVAGQFGALAAVQNPPSVGADRANFIASLGDTLDLAYDDVAFLSGLVEPDGEALGFQIQVSDGALSQGGVAASLVELQVGERFLWQLPDTGDLSDLEMTVVGIDSIAISSNPSPLGVEDANSVTLSVRASNGDSLGSSVSSNLGDVEFPGGTATETYTISNESIVTGSSGNGLQTPPRAAKLGIMGIKVDGAAGNDFDAGAVSLPFFLGPGESVTFTISFRPQEAGDRLASVGLVRPGNPNGFFEFRVQGFGNRPPDGTVDEVLRHVGLEPIKIRVAELLSNDRDLDGDMVRFAGLVAAETARGRFVEVLNDQWLVYYPGVPDEVQDDQFEYRINDGRGSSSTSVVTIREEAFGGQSGAIEATIAAGQGQPVVIRIRGVPGRLYRAQFTHQLNPPNTIWTDLGNPVTASPQNGSFEITDPQPPPGQRIYRIIEAPQQP